MNTKVICMKKNKRNSFDLLVEKFASLFSQIPNFSLTQTDPTANRLVNFIVQKSSEFQNFEILFRRYYIPASNKSVVDLKKELIGSKYRKLIRISQDDLMDNHFETIRLGYVGLFHKIENFQKELIDEVDIAFNEGRGDLVNFIKLKFKYNFKNWHWDFTVKKINWIANRIKHDGSYPNDDIPIQLKHLPNDQRIRISKDEFIKDIEEVSNYYFDIIIKLFLMFGIYKYFSDDFDTMTVTEEMKIKLSEYENMIFRIIE